MTDLKANGSVRAVLKLLAMMGSHRGIIFQASMGKVSAGVIEGLLGHGLDAGRST